MNLHAIDRLWNRVNKTSFIFFRCVPCAKGKYYSAAHKTCVRCPTGQVVWRTPARSIKDCRPCGAGMVSRGGEDCVIDFSFTNRVSGTLKKHDLKPLKG